MGTRIRIRDPSSSCVGTQSVNVLTTCTWRATVNRATVIFEDSTDMCIFKLACMIILACMLLRARSNPPDQVVVA